MSPRAQIRRRGAATVEMAILAPVLAFLFVIATDYARVFYYAVTVADCARNGALYGADREDQAVDTAGIETAALADAGNLSPTPTVSSTTGTDDAGDPYVEVTVTYTFQTITRYPGLPASVAVTRMVRMRVAPLLPDNS